MRGSVYTATLDSQAANGQGGSVFRKAVQSCVEGNLL